MEVLYERCAGLDVHKKTVVACVRVMQDGRVEREVRTFQTTTRELLALVEWLDGHGVRHVAMEATGVYWKPVWHILSDGECELVLANAAHVKNVPGRKSDVSDAAWLADLEAHGLIRASFVPDNQTQELRSLLRTRKQLVRERTSHTLRIQKTLEDANIKLDSVISNIVGLSGRRMIEALVAGESDPATLAGLADRRIKASPQDLCEALRGRVTKHHRFLLALHLGHIDAIEAAIDKIDHEVEADLEPFRAAVDLLSTIPGGQRAVRTEHYRRDRARHGPLPNLRPSHLLGRPLSQERRERRQAPLDPHAQGRALAQDHARSVRLVGCAQQSHLPARPVPAPEGPSRREKGYRRRRRLHPHRRLSHAQDGNRVSRPWTPALRSPPQGDPGQDAAAPATQPRIPRRDQAASPCACGRCFLLDGEAIGQRYGIGKTMDDKPVIRQLISNGLATIRVILDVEDPDEVPPEFSYLLVCSSRFSVSRYILVRHRVSTFSSQRFRYARVARIQGLRSTNTLEWRFCHTPNDIRAACLYR
jgi:transposase